MAALMLLMYKQFKMIYLKYMAFEVYLGNKETFVEYIYILNILPLDSAL